MNTIIERIAAELGPDAVLTGQDVAARPRSFWDPTPIAAGAIVRPRSSAEVSVVLRLCQEARQPVVTHGGRTGCAQGELTHEGEIALSMERMAAIEEIDPEERTAVVQAGCVLETLQQAVAAHGLLFPVDLGARGSCTIGGNIATNAGGMNVLRYGMTRESVLGLEVALADGTLLSSMNRMVKNNAGFDLKQLFIGTEGQLGIVTRAVLRLREAHRVSVTGLVALGGFEAVGAFLRRMDAGLGGALSAFELMYGDFYADQTAPGGHAAPLPPGAAFYVALEAQSADDALPERFEAALSAALEDGLLLDGTIARSQAERAGIWRVREDFEPILRVKPQFLYDVSLPLKAMPGYVETVRAAMRRRWPEARLWVLGHVGDNNLHLFAAPGRDEPGLHEAVDEIVYGPLRAIRGSVSAEHGIGAEKVRWLDVSRTAEEIATMRALKRLFDPNGILNPGKVLA